MILRKRYAALAVIVVGFVVSLYVLPLPRTVNELPANDVVAVPAPSQGVPDSVPPPEPAEVQAPAVAAKNSGAPKVETYSIRGVVVNAKDGQPVVKYRLYTTLVDDKSSQGRPKGEPPSLRVREGDGSRPRDSIPVLVRDQRGEFVYDPMQGPANRNTVSFSVSDRRGEFQLLGLRGPAKWRIECTAPGLLASSVVVTLPEQEEETITIRLSPVPPITGRVTDSEQRPLQGAHVFVGNDELEHDDEGVYTQADGKYSIKVESSVNLLSASYSGLVTKTTPVNLAAPGGATVDFVLEAGASIEGVVTQGGKPVEDAMVNVSGTRPAHSNAEGRYSIPSVGLTNPSGIVEIHCSFGEVATTRVVRITVGSVTVVDFELPSNRSAVSGTVTIRGKAVPSASLILAVATSGGKYRQDATGKGGRFAFSSVPSGSGWLDITSQDESGKSIKRAYPLVIGDNETLDLDIRLEAVGSIAGSLSGVRDGEAPTVCLVAGAEQVSGRIQDMIERLDGLTITDLGPEKLGAGSTFAFPNLAPGTYTVIAVVAPKSKNPEDVEGFLSATRLPSAIVEVRDHQESRVKLSF